MCNEMDKTVMHTLSECSNLAQTEYKKQHDKVPTRAHWELCNKNGFEPDKHWYEHRAEGGDDALGHEYLVEFQHQKRPCYRV